jgi:hypothetical protein
MLVTLANGPLIVDDDLVRLIDTRKIREVLEVVRLLYTSLCGCTITSRCSEATLPNLAGVIGLGAPSCCWRHIVAAAPRANEQRHGGGLSNAYANLVSVLRDIQRISHNSTTGKAAQRIRRLPDAYGHLRWLIAAMAPYDDIPRGTILAEARNLQMNHPSET